MDNLISIIVPVYNVEKYLERCIESIVNQTYQNLEIILVDDGSMDNSGKICDEWAVKDNRIKVIHKENGGVSSARNDGLKKATGEYVGFVDSDDTVEPRYMEILLNLIIEKRVDMSIINYIEKYSEYEIKNETYIKNKEFYKENFFKYLFEISNYKGYLWNKIFKREIIVTNNIIFDENIYICEDLLFVCQVADKCEKFYYDYEEYLYNYYIREESSIRKEYSEQTATRVEVYSRIIEIFDKNNIDSILVKREYMYYALVARNELKNIKRENKIRYTNIAKKYMKEILKTKKIFWIDKVRLIIMLYFSRIFKIMKKIKNGSRKK